jgi:hypothetical protein
MRTDGHGEANSRFSQFCERASNGHPMTDCEGPWEGRKYSSTYSLTSALDGVDGRRHALTTLSPGKGSGTHCRGGWMGAGASLDGCGKSLLFSGFKPRTFQPVASRYTA